MTELTHPVLREGDAAQGAAVSSYFPLRLAMDSRTVALFLPQIRQRLLGVAVVMALTLVWIALTLVWCPLALAVTWYPVAEASQGKQQQLVDLDSIEPLGSGQVRVASIYLDRRSGELQKTTYITDYDCQQRRFRDVQYSGPTGSSAWLPVDPDPLNAAAMDYVCSLIQENTGGIDVH